MAPSRWVRAVSGDLCPSAQIGERQVGGARGRSTVGGPSQGSTVEGRERPLGDFSPGRDSPLGGTQGTRHQLPLTSKLPSTASMLPPLPPAPPVLPGVGLSLLSSSIHVKSPSPNRPIFLSRTLPPILVAATPRCPPHGQLSSSCGVGSNFRNPQTKSSTPKVLCKE
jgi:hypothetical protein